MCYNWNLIWFEIWKWFKSVLLMKIECKSVLCIFQKFGNLCSMYSNRAFMEWWMVVWVLTVCALWLTGTSHCTLPFALGRLNRAVKNIQTIENLTQKKNAFFQGAFIWKASSLFSWKWLLFNVAISAQTRVKTFLMLIYLAQCFTLFANVINNSQ